MAVYVVTWNINQAGSEYNERRDNFLEALEGYDFVQDDDLESVAWIDTDENARQLTRNLRAVLDDNDGLFVSELNVNEHDGWLFKSIWRWIEARR